MEGSQQDTTTPLELVAPLPTAANTDAFLQALEEGDAVLAGQLLTETPGLLEKLKKHLETGAQWRQAYLERVPQYEAEINDLRNDLAAMFMPMEALKPLVITIDEYAKSNDKPTSSLPGWITALIGKVYQYFEGKSLDKTAEKLKKLHKEKLDSFKKEPSNQQLKAEIEQITLEYTLLKSKDAAAKRQKNREMVMKGIVGIYEFATTKGEVLAEMMKSLDFAPAYAVMRKHDLVTDDEEARAKQLIETQTQQFKDESE